ncbi:type IV pilus biogenesis protein PilM [Paenibacillus sp. GYB003]|uniref:type IV pilus biogenesis protein PilM n=1 Tax=Paenibacillus sp. GYB003 TaxID=2994392 RepID=UPI002F96133E
MEKLNRLYRNLFQLPSSSLGLELTDRSIKMIELRKRAGKLPKIYKMASRRLPEGAIVDGKIRDVALVAEAMREIVHANGWRRKKVHMAAPGQSVMVRFLKLPDIPDRELKQIVDFEVHHNVHLPFDEPYYDYCKLNGASGTEPARFRRKRRDAGPDNRMFVEEAAAGGEIRHFRPAEETGDDRASSERLCDVLLVAVPKPLVEDYAAVAERSGLVPASMEIKALSLFRLIGLWNGEEAGRTLLLVDVNESAADISIFGEGRLKMTRSVPLEPVRDEDASAEFIDELERVMNFYRYTLNNRDRPFQAILLSGDSPAVAAMTEAMRERLNVRVDRLLYDRYEPRQRFREDAAAYSVPIGLALRER